MLKDGSDWWCRLCDETCPEVIGTDQTIRTNGKMLQTMVSYKTFPAVSCLLPHPQLFFISGDCHLNLTYMCFNFIVWLKLISILCRNKYPKTPAIASRKQISHNFNSVIGVCKRLGDGRELIWQARKCRIMPKHCNGSIWHKPTIGSLSVACTLQKILYLFIKGPTSFL